MNNLELQTQAQLPFIHEQINNDNIAGLHTEYIAADSATGKQLVIIVSVHHAYSKESAEEAKVRIPPEVKITYTENRKELSATIPLKIKVTGPARAQALDKKVRPCPGGYQITVDNEYGTGTLGVNINYKGKFRLLSNAHVIAPDDSFIKQSVYQPVVGWFWTNKIAVVSGREQVDIYTGAGPLTFNKYDFAYADIIDDNASDTMALSHIVPAGFRAPLLKEEIMVVGKTSAQVRRANILSINATLKYDFYQGKTAYFKDLILLDQLVTQPGDSGAVYIATEDNMIVGMHAAATDANSYGCRIPL